jgi:signal transduction histidine kinase
MKLTRHLVITARDFFAKYPAVLSGYVIYAYLFVSIMHFYIKARAGIPQAYDIFETFSALPFMWFLSVALVKVIEIRTKLQESEKQCILAKKEVELHQAQLQTMQETVRALQHHINNPLTVIKLSMDIARKAAHENDDIDRTLTLAEKSVSRIQNALIDFSSAKQYTSESIDSKFTMASLMSNNRLQEMEVVH